MSDEDFLLFREAVADAQPVRDSGRVQFDLPKPKPIPIHSQRDEDQALLEALEAPDGLSDAMEIGDAERFLRTGLPHKILRDLQRGRWAVQNEIDLHGLTIEEARKTLVLFLTHARRQGMRCVQMIHGKGYGSQTGEPVLRNRVRSWLMQRDEVLAFSDAPAGSGGSGAVVILLKAS
jgi:DNA-nicking Smr family endonuclease